MPHRLLLPLFVLCAAALSGEVKAAGANAVVRPAAGESPIGELADDEASEEDGLYAPEGEDTEAWVDPFADPELLQGAAVPWAAGACASLFGGTLPGVCGAVSLGLISSGGFAPLALPCGACALAGLCGTPAVETLLITSLGNQNPRWPNVPGLDPVVLATAYGSYLLAFAGYAGASVLFVTMMGIGAQTGLFPFLTNGTMNEMGPVIALAMAFGGGVTLLVLQPVVPLFAYLFTASGYFDAPQLELPYLEPRPQPPAGEGESVIRRERRSERQDGARRRGPLIRAVAY